MGCVLNGEGMPGIQVDPKATKRRHHSRLKECVGGVGGFVDTNPSKFTFFYKMDGHSVTQHSFAAHCIVRYIH